MEMAFATAVTGTGLVTMSSMPHHYLSGWYFTETSGAGAITVILRKNTAGGTIIEQLVITANGSVGEDYDKPISLQAVHVTISGVGTVQGHVRGR